jgi:hypothetical protein
MLPSEGRRVVPQSCVAVAQSGIVGRQRKFVVKKPVHSGRDQFGSANVGTVARRRRDVRLCQEALGLPFGFRFAGLP